MLLQLAELLLLLLALDARLQFYPLPNPTMRERLIACGRIRLPWHLLGEIYSRGRIGRIAIAIFWILDWGIEESRVERRESRARRSGVSDQRSARGRLEARSVKSQVTRVKSREGGRWGDEVMG